MWKGVNPYHFPCKYLLPDLEHLEMPVHLFFGQSGISDVDNLGGVKLWHEVKAYEIEKTTSQQWQTEEGIILL